MSRRAFAALLGVALAPAALPAGPPVGERLAVASYNVQFVTPDVPLLGHFLREFPGHRPNVAARAEAIGRALACFDVVALQETINDRRRAEIFAALERHGRACGKPSRLASGRMFELVDGPDLVDSDWLPLVDDELALASRLPVRAVAMLTFADAAEEDVLAAKGVLHASLAHGAGDIIEVFVTHLQAGREHAAVRQAQITQLTDMIRRHAAPDAPVLVLGDFNLWGGAPDRADPRSEYNALLVALNAAVAPRRFVDLWLATHADDPETGSGTKPRVLADGSVRPREKRIDFILLAGAGRVRPAAMRHEFLRSEVAVDGAPLGDLSNHAALLAEILWAPPRRAPSAAAAAMEATAHPTP